MGLSRKQLTEVISACEMSRRINKKWPRNEEEEKRQFATTSVRCSLSIGNLQFSDLIRLWAREQRKTPGAKAPLSPTFPTLAIIVIFSRSRDLRRAVIQCSRDVAAAALPQPIHGPAQRPGTAPKEDRASGRVDIARLWLLADPRQSPGQDQRLCRLAPRIFPGHLLARSRKHRPENLNAPVDLFPGSENPGGAANGDPTEPKGYPDHARHSGSATFQREMDGE